MSILRKNEPSIDSMNHMDEIRELIEAQHRYIEVLGNKFAAAQGRGNVNEAIYLDEQVSSAGSVTSLQLTLNIDTPCLVTSIITGFTGTSAVLQIGDRLIPLQNSMPTITGAQMLIYKTDKIILTGSSGPMFIEIMGHPMKGVEWNRT